MLARLKNDETVSTMASHLKITERQYRYIEAGTRDTSSENWLKLHRLFAGEIPLDKLMENTPKPDKPNPATQ